ncbi:MAG: cell division protein FtsW [Lachnospiraceae bacterium]|nr:cell division protein FtsW [Lachnospiraceae bacterium]
MAGRKRQKKQEKVGFYDYGLLFLILFLVGFGLIMIYSTSYYSATIHKNGDSMYYLKRQGLLAIVGIIAMLLISKMDYRWVLKPIPRTKISWVVFIYMVAVFLQTYVLFGGIELNGARRWISLGPLGTFQPSDLSKAAVILMIAFMVNQRPRALDSLNGFIMIAIPVGFLLLLIAIENMSTAIVVGLILMFMCYIASRKLWYFLLMGAAGGGLGVLYILLGEGFRMERIQIWLNVENHEKGGQILQGLYAIASGGAFGKGLGQSMQKLGYVPEAQNDMIFSIICEELGMFGAFAIMLVFILLFWHILQIAMNAPDLFGGMLCSGVLVHVASQVLLNIAVVTNSIPSTGVALPFISYGGTSVMILLAEMGIVLSVSNRIR